MKDVAVIGVGCTVFGEKWNHSFRDLFIEAGALALEDANLSGEQIDALFVGNMSAGRFIEQNTSAPSSPITQGWPPSIRRPHGWRRPVLPAGLLSVRV
jgi:Acetyl-CoA acetyltransferase